jgi:plastocyanin
VKITRAWIYCVALLAGLAACREKEAPPAEASKPALVVDPSTAAELEVVVRLDGQAPPPKTITMRAAPACASQHPGAVYDPSLVIREGRVANAVVWVEKGLEAWSFSPPSTPVVIDQKGCMYEPHVVIAQVGQDVEFRNSDPEPHNVHSRPRGERGWNFMLSRAGTARTVRFEKPEVAVPIGCDVHPWMSAYVAVLEHPYGGVTAADGGVRLGPLPPGTYDIAVWHERLGKKDVQISLAAGERKRLEVVFSLPSETQ